MLRCSFFRSCPIFFLYFFISFVSTATAAVPVVFFSDITDGPRSGWDGSETQGAAVTIWGKNFGSSGSISCGGDTIQSTATAEWGAISNPTSARGLQRITFWLNSSMQKGEATISVTTADGTSAAIPFYIRDSGTIYFVAPNGDDFNDGLSTATPWKTAMKARGTVAPGDVVYFRGGSYTGEGYRDTTSVTASNYCYIHFYNGNHAVGSVNNSITFAAYPAELPVFGDGTDSIPLWIRQYSSSPTLDQMDYWTFSKFKIQVYNSALLQPAGSYSTSHYLRFVGFDATTTGAAAGTGICFWFTGNQGQDDLKFYGNYVHHTGKALDWQEADGSGYKVGPLYVMGFGEHGTVDMGWNEFAYNNGSSQFYGQYKTDSISLLKFHDNYIHHTTTAPASSGFAATAIFGGGSDSDLPQGEYAYLQEALIYNNLFVNNGGGIKIGDTTSYGSHGGDISYYNNTHYGNTDPTWREFTLGNQDSVTLENNIFYTTAGSGDYYNNEGTITLLRGANNIYYGLSNGVPVWDDTMTSSQEDPLLADPANDDYSLQEASPSRSAGEDLSSFFQDDFLGNIRTKWDIGALEYETYIPPVTPEPPEPPITPEPPIPPITPDPVVNPPLIKFLVVRIKTGALVLPYRK